MSINRISKFNYQLHFSNSVCEPFLKSILFMINNFGGALIKSTKGYCIDFCAHGVSKLVDCEKLDYNLVVSMMNCLNKQNAFLLKKHDCGMFYIDLKDIIVIDSSTFIYCSSENIRKITFGLYLFNSPFSRDSNTAFFSPEIMVLNKIPAAISFKCFYYSLGALAIYCLFNKNITARINEIVDIADIKKILFPILQTKLYWTILKSTAIDCEKRTLLFI